MNWLLKRLSEPSTAASIGVLVTTSAGMANGSVPVAIGFPAIIGSLFGMFMSEKKNQ